MQRDTTNAKQTAQWHLWLIGVTMLLLSLVGLADFVLANLHSQSYFNYMHYGSTQIAYFTTYPLALKMLWGVGVVMSVIALAMLLLQSRYTARAFL